MENPLLDPRQILADSLPIGEYVLSAIPEPVVNTSPRHNDLFQFHSSNGIERLTFSIEIKDGQCLSIEDAAFIAIQLKDDRRKDLYNETRKALSTRCFALAGTRIDVLDSDLFRVTNHNYLNSSISNSNVKRYSSEELEPLLKKELNNFADLFNVAKDELGTPRLDIGETFVPYIGSIYGGKRVMSLLNIRGAEYWCSNMKLEVLP